MDHANKENNTQRVTQSNFLDSYKSNCNTTRKSYCGRFTLGGPEDSGGLFPYWMVFCKTYGCPVCGPLKRWLLKKAIFRCIGEHDLRVFATLTIDPKDTIPENSVKYIQEIWRKHRIYQKRFFHKNISYIKVVEFQKNTGNAHLHILLDSYVDHAWLKQSWMALGGGAIVDIRKADEKAAHYISKYFTKEIGSKEHGRFRRVNTSRNIKLFLKNEIKKEGFQFHKLEYAEAKFILEDSIKEIKKSKIKGEIGFLSDRPLRTLKANVNVRAGGGAE